MPWTPITTGRFIYIFVIKMARNRKGNNNGFSTCCLHIKVIALEKLYVLLTRTKCPLWKQRLAVFVFTKKQKRFVWFPYNTDVTYLGIRFFFFFIERHDLVTIDFICFKLVAGVLLIFLLRLFSMDVTWTLEARELSEALYWDRQLFLLLEVNYKLTHEVLHAWFFDVLCWGLIRYFADGSDLWNWSRNEKCFTFAFVDISTLAKNNIVYTNQ